jgi:hypothetical protein
LLGYRLAGQYTWLIGPVNAEKRVGALSICSG